MVDISNFIVRKSGKKDEKFYIDYIGKYKINDFSKITCIEVSQIKDIFISNNAVFDEESDVYYFDSIEKAKIAIEALQSKVKNNLKGRIVHLTDTEIEYIRKALINDGSDMISKNSKLKDTIFKKLNF